MRILLFSGGIESTCLAYMLKPDVCLTIDYGQTCFMGEYAAAQNISTYFGLKHALLKVDLAELGSGQLAGKPAIKDASIPELWPFRNQLLITLAAMKYVGQPDLEILIGSAKGDSAHADGTVQFVERMYALMNMQEGQVKVSAPAIEIDSIDLIRNSNIDVDVLDMTFSCFRAEYPCGQCRGCWKNESLRVAYFDERPSCNRQR